MQQRSSHNWKTKSGTWDSLHTALIDFESDYPALSSTIALPDKFTITNCNDYKNVTKDSLISMFVDDYILERFWNNPNRYVHRFASALAVMSPDFSLLVGMPLPMQMWNVYRNRLVGYVWQQAGLNVIPTISWSDSGSFDFCFEGVERGAVVAVSNTGCKTEAHKRFFDAGYSEMMRRIEPKQVIFQCAKKYRHQYESKTVIFVDSFWDSKRKNGKI